MLWKISESTGTTFRAYAHVRRRRSKIPLAEQSINYPLLLIFLVVMLSAGPIMAAETRMGGEWKDEFWGNVKDPWFAFGMAAQGLFFLRFVIQWIVSEKRKRSTIPVAFWYLSLAGAAATFVYAMHEAQPVFILAQVLACVIYVRNLMLISQRAERRKRAGLPVRDLESTNSDDMPDRSP